MKAENIIYHNTFHKFKLWDRIKILLGRELMVRSEIETEGEAEVTGNSIAKSSVAPLFRKKVMNLIGRRTAMKAGELRKLFADEREICISDCKFIPEAYPNGYAEWLEKKIQNADEVSREEVLKWHRVIADFLGEINKQIEFKQERP